MLETVFQSRTMDYLPQIAEPQVRLHLLVVDTDSAIRSACAEIASSLGYAVESTGDMVHARSLLRGRAADILLVNLPFGSSLGLDLVTEVKLLYPQTSVIAMTASSSVNAAGISSPAALSKRSSSCSRRSTESGSRGLRVSRKCAITSPTVPLALRSISLSIAADHFALSA